MTPSDVISLIYSELLKIAGGASLVLAALSAFLGKVWIERIHKADAARQDARLAEFKAELDKQAAEMKAARDVISARAVLVDKIQFEHEYSIYRQAWESLYSLQQATLRLRRIVDQSDAGVTEEQRVAGRAAEFNRSYALYLEVVEKNKPFYPVDIYATLGSVRDACARELMISEDRNRPQKDYWFEAGQSHKAILDAIECACGAIRNRVAKVRVG